MEKPMSFEEKTPERGTETMEEECLEYFLFSLLLEEENKNRKKK